MNATADAVYIARETVGGFYQSEEWRRLRYQALLGAQGCCIACGNRAAPGRSLHVDHIKPRSKFPELALSLSNLQVLCEDCNFGKGAIDQTDWRR
jgi:5-methylcytosine-specific restriction endonuclease McrA